MAELATKLQGYGVRVHSDLRAVVILANTEWAAQQTCRAEISVAHSKIVAKYRYNHSHDADSIREVLKILATADALRDRRKAKAPGELADIVSQGMTRLQKLVQQQPASQYQSDSYEESANAAKTTDSEGPATRRGRRKQKERKHSRHSPSPSTSQSPSPTVRRKRKKNSGRMTAQKANGKTARRRTPRDESTT